jgi:general secretion pathway protein G
MAMPALKNVPRKAAEAVLKSDLRTFRDAIDQFHADQGYYPPTLEALVEEGYFRAMPVDPITKRSDTWVEIYDEPDPDFIPAETDLPEDGQPGIVDVRSGSMILSVSGTPYYEW